MKLTVSSGPDPTGLIGHISDEAVARAVQNAQVVLLPESIDEETGKAVFRPNAKDVLDHLRDGLPPSVSVDIAATDDDFAELLLHSDEIWLPTLLVLAEPGAITVTLNVLSNYIYERLKGFKALVRPDSARVRARLLVSGKGRSRTVTFEYDGPPDAFTQVMVDAISKELGES